MLPSHEHAPYRDDEPDRLPGESRRAYRTRTDPGRAQYEKRRREVKRTERADRRLALFQNGEITEDEYNRRVADADAHYDEYGTG